MFRSHSTGCPALACLAVVAAWTSFASPSLALDLQWNVAGGGDWDFVTPNWTGDATIYSDGDNVTFDNPAGGVIQIVGDVAPGSTTVSAASGTYTFTGANITSGNLSKSGAGTLVMDTSHTGTGPTIAITGGTLRLEGHNLFPSTAVRTGSGDLDMNGFDQTFASLGNSQTRFINMGHLTIEASIRSNPVRPQEETSNRGENVRN